MLSSLAHPAVSKRFQIIDAGLIGHNTRCCGNGFHALLSLTNDGSTMALSLVSDDLPSPRVNTTKKLLELPSIQAGHSLSQWPPMGKPLLALDLLPDGCVFMRSRRLPSSKST